MRAHGMLIAIACLLGLTGGSALAQAPHRDPDACRSVRFGVVGWSDVAAVSAVSAAMLERLGYAPRTLTLSLPVIFASLANADVDVFLGNWMPAQAADRRPYLDNGSIEDLGPNLIGAKFTLAVPAYLFAAGLKSFADIRRFSTELNGTIYGIEPGSAANRLILGMIRADADGLGGFRLLESSEQGMLTELDRAYRAHRPIVFVGWDPHPMNVRYDLAYLSGGDATFGPDFGGASIHTVTRAGLTRECPNIGRLLANLKLSTRTESEIMAAVLTGTGEPQARAQHWLATHASITEGWLRGVSRFDGETPHAQDFAASAARGRPFEAWLAERKIPVGATLSGLLEQLKMRDAAAFDALSATIRAAVSGLTKGLAILPATVFILVAATLAAWLKRSVALGILVLLGLTFVLNQGFWAPMLETLSLVLCATALASLCGIPLGIAAARHPRFEAGLRPLLDLMQTLPAFVYLIPTLLLFGLGPVPGLLSTVVFAMPAVIRLTQQGLQQVPTACLETARAFGATSWQRFWKVELPAAAPLVRAGITQCIMLSLSMVVVAALVGAGGLGVPVIRALGSVQVGAGFDAGFAIVLLAVILDRVCRPRERR